MQRHRADKKINMDKIAVKKALRTPYKPLLDYAMTFVSLSEKERKVLTLCLIELLTEEKRRKSWDIAVILSQGQKSVL